MDADLIAQWTIAIASITLLVLLGLSLGIGKLQEWHHRRRDYVTHGRVRSAPLRSAEPRFAAVSAEETNTETAETARRVAETEKEKIHFAETAVADALARLIIAEELDKTTAVKIGAGKKSGEGYQKWSRLVQAAIERQKEPPFPALVEQQLPRWQPEPELKER